MIHHVNARANHRDGGFLSARDLPWAGMGAALLTILAACAGGGGDGGGVTYQAMPRLALTAGVTICADGEAEGCQFVTITTGAVGPDGRVALVGMKEVSQFDAAGNFVRTIGGLGGGPGEYRQVMALTYDDVGALALYDLASRRLLRFDSTGAPLGGSRVELPPGTQAAGFMNGGLVFAVLPGAAEIGDMVETLFLAPDDSGAATVVVGRAPAHAIATGDGSLVPIATPFAPAPTWGIGDGGLYFAQEGELRIVRAGEDGARAVVDMGVVGPPITSAERDSAREVMLRPGRGGQMPAAMEAELRRSVEGALARADGLKTHPSVRQLVSVGGDGGRLWAREAVATAPDSVRWNAFSADGTPEGYILLRARSTILTGDGDRILVLERDDQDVPRCVWYTVGRPAR